jgi:hypothetical protein
MLSLARVTQLTYASLVKVMKMGEVHIGFVEDDHLTLLERSA